MLCALAILIGAVVLGALPATGMFERLMGSPASGDTIKTTPITLTDADVKAILTYLAGVYTGHSSVGYNATDNTFFYTDKF